MFRTVPLSIIRSLSLYTQQWYSFADSLQAGAYAPARKLSANLYNTYHCCVYSEKLLMMDRGVHYREFFTVHTAMVYVIQFCRQLASRIRTELQFHPDPARKLSANLYNIYHCCVYSEKLLMMDRGTVRNM